MIKYGGLLFVMPKRNPESFVDVYKRSVAQQLDALLPGASRARNKIKAYVLSFSRLSSQALRPTSSTKRPRHTKR